MKKFKKLVGAATGALLAVSLLTGTVLSAGALGARLDADTPIESGEESVTTSQKMEAYLFVHFIDAEETADKEQMYFSVSRDGTSWKMLNNKKPVLKSTVGEQGIRDPNIIRKEDGSGFYLIATDLSIYNLFQQGKNAWSYCQSDGSHSIVVWESENLVDWTLKGLKEISRENAGCTWAPEAVYDDEKEAYMVHWASRTKEDGKQRVYRCYTKDFETFTPPELYIEAETSRIDCTFIKEDDTYYRFTKDEEGGRKYVYMEKSTSLSGEFEAVNTYSIDGHSHTYYHDGGAHSHAYEGPTVYKMNGEEKWALLLDEWTYKPFITDDITTGRFVSGSEFNFGGVRYRHGSVIPITMAEYEALVAKYPFVDATGDDSTGTGDPIYALDFEENLNATAGTQVATGHGTITYEDGVNGGKAAKISGNGNYVSIDGSMLKDKTSFTVSFAAKVSGKSWMFLAAPNGYTQKYESEHYIGAVADCDGGHINQVVCERYNSTNQGRPASAAFGYTKNEWFHVTLVYRASRLHVYVDGVLVANVTSSVNIATMLGDNPVIQLGLATWTSGAEYSNMVFDCFKIHDYAMDGAQALALYKADMGIS